jgi:hypothetical protein
MSLPPAKPKKDRMIPRREIPAVVRQITGGAKNPHEQTVRRWYSKGIRGVRLEVTYVGGEVFTTHRQLKCFFAQVQIAAAAGRQNDRPRPPKGRRGIQTLTANLAAARVLSRLGQTTTATTGQTV